MSLTNRRPVPGSSTSRIIRGDWPSTNGREANSTTPTVMTPSVAGIGSGNGSSVVWPAVGSATSTSTAAASTAVAPKRMPMACSVSM